MKRRFDLGVYAETLLPMAAGEARPLAKQFLGVRDGVIAEVGPWRASRKAECKKFIDGTGQVALPGLVNGHAHLAMSLLRGVEDDVPFHTWLFDRILPLEAKLVSRDFVRAGTRLAALESIRFGVTSLNEMYFYSGEAAAVLDAAGLRGIVSQCFADFPLPEDKDLGTDKFALVEKLARRYAGHDRIRIGFGPHAPYSCGDELLKRVAAESARLGLPVHIHLSETAREVAESVEKHGKTPVERLYDLGLLRVGTICAHCVHLSENDRVVFGRAGASAVYNPDSNMKLGSGAAPVADYQKRGIPWAFGTDGAASNNDLSLFGAMDLGTKLQKFAQGDTTALTAAAALRAGTWGGARALGMGDRVGSLELGKAADFILVDLRHPHLQPVNDVASHLVYSAQGMEVSHTVCAGRVLFENGRFRTLDPKRIYADAARWQKKIATTLKGIR